MIKQPEIFFDKRSGWRVLHPSNDAVLAYCDSREEATAVAEALTTIGTLLEQLTFTEGA